MRRNVVLPQPDGPDHRDECAALDLEIDAAQRLELAEALAEIGDHEPAGRHD